MKELSLFTGAGGGLLGTKLLGWEPIGYVEFNDYCQRVIRQRIIDGVLPNAPIFGDVRAFIGEGYAASYTGLVDVITGGFPCQPFSVAGKQLGADDPRNMWPATIDCIRIIRPRYAFMENVPGLVTSGYFGTILSGLHESGYDCRWRILSAAELGAPHKRDRLWIRAERRDFLSHADNGRIRWREQQPQGISEKVVKLSTDSNRKRWQRCGTKEIQRKRSLPWGEGFGSFTDKTRRPDIPEPLLSGVANGLVHRLDRTRAIGNGQVPIVVATAWRLLGGE